FTRFVSVQSGKLSRQGVVHLGIYAAVNIEYLSSRQNGCVFIQDINQGQVVTFTYFIVIEVMTGGDLDAAGTKLTVYLRDSNERGVAVLLRQCHNLADKRLVTLIFRMDSNRTVTGHGLRAGGGYSQIVAPDGRCGAVSEGVAQVPELAFFIIVLHRKIGDG